jgi:dephospho-CoA kinase
VRGSPHRLGAMTVVALTGGVGAGKSTVAEVLASRGAHIIDADLLARQAVEPGSKALEEIAARFGPGVLDEKGHLDRGKLGAIVFSDASARSALNDIVHPQVKKLYDEALAMAELERPNTVIVYVVPLLAEARQVSEFDSVIVVHAPAAMRVQRLMEYRGMSSAEARERVDAQVSDEERLSLAHVVLDASGDLDSTKHAAHQLYEELVSYWPDRLSELSRHFPRDES